jgi:hypothetical protein
MIGLSSLATGAANRVAIAAYQGKQTGETSLLQSILHLIVAGRRSLLRFVLVVCSRHDKKD